MEKSYSGSYKAAGVDVTAGYRAVELMKEHVARTKTAGVLEGLGGFGGLFGLNLSSTPNPVLVSGTDGVGTKLKLAFLADRHDTVGIDCVAMCVNDIICCGAKPLFFLDYMALGKNVPERVAAVVKGIADGCVQAGCALIGGETAEMPGFYPENEYDLAGFCVGLVDRERILDRENVAAGDAIIGLRSSGVHSNGFSLVRQVFGDLLTPEKIKTPAADRLLDTLLTPTKIYVKPVLALLQAVRARSISHITGGGFYENLPRALNARVDAVIHKSAFPVPSVFGMLQTQGNIPERDMFNTFNMGIGMAIVVATADADQALSVLLAHGEEASVIGEIVPGDGSVHVCA